MSQSRSLRLRWAVLALPVLALGPAVAQDADEQAPGEPIEDAGVSTPFALRTELQQWSIGDPTGEEQQLLELMNRARLDPVGEGDRIFIDYGSKRVTQAVNFFLDQRPTKEYTRGENRDAFKSYSAKPPFAFSGKLIEAARGHSQKLKQFDQQSHQITNSLGAILLDLLGNPVEKGLRGRIEDQGYIGSFLAESVFSYAEDMVHAHAGFAIDYGQGIPTGQSRPSLGHRLNLMAFDNDPGRRYAEVGVGVVADASAATHVGPRIVTIDFAIPASSPSSFVTGVCWDDKNQSGFYDPGEGIGGVRIELDVGNRFAISSASGGYAVPVDGSPGTVHVTATGTPSTPSAIVGTQVVTVNMAGVNVKADFSSPPPPPLPPVTEITLAPALQFDDAGPLLSTIDVAAMDGQPTLIGDLQCAVAIDHAARDEFKATLISPSGIEVVLFDHGPGGSGLSGTFPSSLTPHGSLDTCIGESYVGSWKLRLEDTASGNAGTLTSWSLRIRPQWIRPLFSPASPLFVTKLTVKDKTKPLGDSVTFNAQVDTQGVALDAQAPCDLRLRSADAVRTELLHVTIPATAIKYAVSGTSRTTIAAKVAAIDIPAPLPAEVYVELSIGGAIVGETVKLAKGSFNGATTLPKSALFRIDSMTTKIVSGVPNYTVKGRFSGAADAITEGQLEVVLGNKRVADQISASSASSTKFSYKRPSGLKKLTIDAKKGTFLFTMASSESALTNGFVNLSLRLGDSGFFGAAAIKPKVNGSSLTY